MSDNARPSFISACRTFFGFQPGQNLSGFSAEMKALTYKDKMDLAQGMRDIGIFCFDPVNPHADMPQAAAA